VLYIQTQPNLPQSSPPCLSGATFGSVMLKFLTTRLTGWQTAATDRCTADSVESFSNIVTARLTYYITDRCSKKFIKRLHCQNGRCFCWLANALKILSKVVTAWVTGALTSCFADRDALVSLLDKVLSASPLNWWLLTGPGVIVCGS